MKKLFVWIVVFCCIVAADVIGGADAPKHPGEGDVVFELMGGLLFGFRDDIDHFISVLGDPVRRYRQHHPYGGLDMVMLEFDGITVLFIEETGAVYAIWVSNPQVRTSRGIGVGAPVSAVRAVYGDRFHELGADRVDYEVFNENRDAALTFALNDGIVVEIVIAATW
ncbi:MAG: hypothetical protein EA426_02030 [Spirochaetaceae bacterium]|nr:MAG: hypothetical protein EA426_02030 [Spirochaetaceae bacterium]